MTKIILEQESGSCVICARGHATGSAEVCAAVSCLLYTIAGWLNNNPQIGGIHRLDDGDAAISFITRDPSARTVFELAKVGFLQLAGSYPDYISVETHDAT